MLYFFSTGKYTVNVKYGGKHVPKSPAKIDVKPKGDASKCKLKGPGLESPVVNEPTSFDVDCKRAGSYDLDNYSLVNANSGCYKMY